MITSSINNFSSMKQIKAKVELYQGSTLVTTCSCDDVLANFQISREGEAGKYFGFGICQQLTLNLIDLNKAIKLASGFTAKICLGNGVTYDCPYPTFTLNEVTVDKKSGDISATAHDPIYKAGELTVADLSISAPYTLRAFVTACATALGIEVMGLEDSAFDLQYEDGGNYEGYETLREALNHAAEVTQTIYYINYGNKLVFKRLSSASVSSYTKADYYEFETAEAKTLKAICSVTELGDNITADSTTVSDGVTQYIRNNPLLELREDAGTILDAAIARIGGFTLPQFALDWSGDYRLEIGDCITVQEDVLTKLYILNDLIEYDGTFNEHTQWTHAANDTDTDSNSTSIGERLNETFAKVDKANKNITMLTSTSDEHSSKLSSLEINTESISGSVKAVEQKVDDTKESLEEDIVEITKELNLKISADQMNIAITEAVDGVDKITTQTGYTFDSEGLKISKSSSEINTIITEDGMQIKRSQTAVLTANNQGVQAQDLHATTYLIIGKNSRFEDMNDNRTACFWIGG